MALGTSAGGRSWKTTTSRCKGRGLSVRARRVEPEAAPRRSASRGAASAEYGLLVALDRFRRLPRGRRRRQADRRRPDVPDPAVAVVRRDRVSGEHGRRWCRWRNPGGQCRRWRGRRAHRAVLGPGEAVGDEPAAECDDATQRNIDADADADADPHPDTDEHASGAYDRGARGALALDVLLDEGVAELAAGVELLRQCVRLGQSRVHRRTGGARVANTLPQCGRAANGASACSTARTAGSTAAVSSTQVKWSASVSRPLAGLARARLGRSYESADLQHGRHDVPRLPRRRRVRPAPSDRATKYSLCSSSPLLGVNSSLKCGRRACQRPGTPELLRAVLGRHARHHVPRPLGRPGAELLGEGGSSGTVGPAGRRRPVLAQDLELPGLHPLREEAHAVGAGDQGVEVLERGGGGQPQVHLLPDLERRHEVERERRDHTEASRERSTAPAKRSVLPVHRTTPHSR